MSYSILYRVMHIRLSDNTYVPMCECGDNNCYDGPRHRSRSWATHFTWWRKKLSYTADEIRETIEGVIRRNIENAMKWETTQGRTYEEMFKNYGDYAGLALYGHDHGWMSGTQMLNFWMKGIKNSVDFEFLRNHCIGVHIWDGDELIVLYDEQTLIDTYNRITEKRGYSPSIELGTVSDFDYRDACHQHDPAPKEKLPLLKGYAIHLGYEDHYVNKITSRRMWHTWDFHGCKVYSTKAAATKAVAHVNKYYAYYTPKIVPVHRENEKAQWQITQTA